MDQSRSRMFRMFFLKFFTPAMLTTPVALCDRFVFGRKKYPVRFFHPLAGETIQTAIDAQFLITRQLNLALVNQFPQQPAGCKSIS